MAYKRPESSYYYVRRKNLPGFGDTGAISSRSKSKRVAERMERLLEELAERALVEPKWRELLEAVTSGEVDLPDLLKAKTERRLPALLRSLDDPLLTDAVADYRPHVDDRQTGYGFDKLLEMTEAQTRLSALQDAGRVTALCRRCEEEYGVKRNTVRRQLYRAISLLLRHHYGNAERDRVFQNVQYEGEDDTREVYLTPEEIAALLQACEDIDREELGVLIRMALLTSADRGVLLAGTRSDGPERGLLVRDVRVWEEDGAYHGEVYLPDRKTEDRSRTIPFGDRLAREVLLLAQGKGPDDPLFNIRYRALDYIWQQAREVAGLEELRFKDLRSQTAIYAQKAGIPQAVVMRTLGHSSERRTRQYQRHEAVMSADQVAALEEAMFARKAS